MRAVFQKEKRVGKGFIALIATKPLRDIGKAL
jgi:hypothetical protein